jgi:hypothetical protein
MRNWVTGDIQNWMLIRKRAHGVSAVFDFTDSRFCIKWSIGIASFSYRLKTIMILRWLEMLLLVKIWVFYP